MFFLLDKSIKGERKDWFVFIDNVYYVLVVVGGGILVLVVI